MSTNAIMSCDWPSAKALVEDIHAEELNVTNVVAKCVNVCDLTLESKRSELLGEGIMISSLIHVTLFSVFGILLPAIIWLLDKRSTAKVAPSTILLREIQTRLLDTSGFLMISIFVAAISTCSQASAPSIMELTFLCSLVDLQLWYIIGMIFSQSADRSMNQAHAGRNLPHYYYALLFAQFATSSSIKIPHLSVYKDLAKECHKQHQFIDVISSVSDGAELPKHVGIGFGITLCFLVALGLCATYITVVPPRLARLWETVWIRVPSWLKNYAHIIGQFFVIGMYVGLLPLNLHRLEKVRKLAVQTSGAQPTGEERWGYGQTTAILLWLPFFFSAIKETIKHIRNPPQPETPQAKIVFLEKGESPSPAADTVPPPYDYPHPVAVSTVTPPISESKN